MIKKSIKFVALSLLLIGAALGLHAQIKFNLTLLPDNQTYLVSFLSEVTFECPDNITGSAQVVLKLPSNQPFQAGNIVSLVEGVTWSDNAYLDAPEAAPDWTFVTFGLESPFTKNIQYAEGSETPLFTFQNIVSECSGRLFLPDNDDPDVLAVKASGFNVTQNMTVFGSNGNAFSGLVNGMADCSPMVSSVSDANGVVGAVNVFPMPASEYVDIEWEMLGEQPNDVAILLTDINGKVVINKEIDNIAGKNKARFDVKEWPTGLYLLNFSVQGKLSQGFKVLAAH